MIRHVVLWKLKEQAEGRSKMENAKMIKVQLEALPGLVPEIRRLEVGADVSRTGPAGTFASSLNSMIWKP